MLRWVVRSSMRFPGLTLVAWTGLVVLSGAATARDGDDPPAKSDVLEGQGLKLVGTTYVLNSEDDVKTKAADLRKLSRELKSLQLKQAATVTPQAYQAYLQNLNAQIGELKAEAQMARQQTNSIPRYRGRMARYYGQAERSQANAYVNQLNQEINQLNQALNQAKKSPPDPRTKQQVDSQVLTAQTERDQAVEALSKAVHATKEKYDELAKDKAVAKALKDAAAKVKPSPLLGPSHEFQEIAKQLDKLEKEFARGAGKSKSRTKSSHGSGFDF
ncbi:hypothetical protein [Aquisphaera insulae]|uniref:hypothetical protein n=1 Tax=Aquisphaera insulae TaxID=2712864 RepID=UPI0013EB845E|nr:hypothetical protein [Aquisphaera insulae]